jgi:tripartite-type tricarboxylate transporter receptor subunit TctC
MRRTLSATIGAIALASSSLMLISPSCADDVAAFYANKRISLYIGFPPGAGYDIYSRLVARHLGRHIRGRPELIPTNMPGGSSRVAASYLYNVAPKDGLALGVVEQVLPLAQALGQVGKFDMAKFRWIGSPDNDVRVVTTWHASGIATVADAKSREVTMGATGVSEAPGYPELMNTLVATRFKMVRGYPGGAAVNLAMERGEVDGRADNGWTSWKSDHATWIQEKKIHILLQVGLTKAPDLSDVPLLTELTSNPQEREALKLISTPSSLGHPLIAPPGVPEERVQALRQAFDAMMVDPAFLADAEALRRPIRAIAGAELERIAHDVLSAPSEAKQRARALTGQK